MRARRLSLVKRLMNGPLMSRRVQLATLTIALFAAAAQASEIRLYPSFAEVRERVPLSGLSFTWLPGSLVDTLIGGSLSLDGANVSNLVSLPGTSQLLPAFEGKEVLVRRGTQNVRARVVNAELSLFEAEGQFFQANAGDVIYPSLEGIRLTPQFTFNFASNANSQGTLSYLTRGLAWSPRYNLEVSEGPETTAALTAWADVRNLTRQLMSAPNLELVAGDVRLVGRGHDEGLFVAQSRNFDGRADVAVAPAGEMGGLQLYRYDKPVSLPAGSVTSLRFLDAKVGLERVLDYSSGFNASPRLVVPLSRIYTVRAQENLPSGTVTVREGARVVGQVNIGDTPKDEPAVLNLGGDFDIRLTRTVTTLARTRNTVRYRVNYSLTNTKRRPVTVRLREAFSGTYDLENIVLPNVERDENTLTSKAELAPGARLEGSLVVSFRYS